MTPQQTVPEMRLELVPVPVSDVDRAKAFYEGAGFQLLVDTRVGDTMRVVQLTPPGSACTILLGTGMPEISDMAPGSVRGLHLVVDDLDQARQALIDRGVEVDQVTEVSQVRYAGFRGPPRHHWRLPVLPPGGRRPAPSGNPGPAAPPGSVTPTATSGCSRRSRPSYADLARASTGTHRPRRRRRSRPRRGCRRDHGSRPR